MPFAVEQVGLDPAFVDYREAWSLQQRYHCEVVAGDRPSTLLTLEHEPVYTAGKRTEPHERPMDGTPVVDIDRGGKITWHGPGQLVVYPIYRLNDPKDVKLYVWQIEEAIIEVLAARGITAGRVDGRAGVWLEARGTLPERKIGAIGIRIHEGVTMHGLALNCSNDSTGFDNIVPCGIADAGVTTISAELSQTVTPADIVDEMVAALQRHVNA